MFLFFTPQCGYILFGKSLKSVLRVNCKYTDPVLSAQGGGYLAICHWSLGLGWRLASSYFSGTTTRGEDKNIVPRIAGQRIYTCSGPDEKRFSDLRYYSAVDNLIFSEKLIPSINEIIGYLTVLNLYINF